jgi:hemolysin activation/secretion protein
LLVTDALLERQLMLLNDLPGLKARATLVPGQQFGSTAVEVETSEKIIGASFGVSNAGKPEIGERRVEGGVELNNPLRIGDQFTLRAMRSTDGLFRYRRVGYSLPLGADGIRLAVSATATDYDLGGAFAALGISGRVRSADATVSYPFVRSRAKNVIGALQWRQTTTQQDVLGLPFSEAKLPLLVGSVYANWVGADSSATAVSLAASTNVLRKGTNTAGTDNRQFIKMDGEVTYLTGAARNWDLFLRGRMVHATTGLPDTEKMSLGGPDSVRGYTSSQYRGDSGYQMTAELRRQWLVFGTPGYVSVFADLGGVNNKGFLGYDKLASTGVGLTHYLGGHGQVRVEYARPLLKVYGRDTGSKLWATMTVVF